MMAKMNELCVEAATVLIAYISVPMIICLLTEWDALGGGRGKVCSLNGSTLWFLEIGNSLLIEESESPGYRIVLTRLD